MAEELSDRFAITTEFAPWKWIYVYNRPVRPGEEPPDYSSIQGIAKSILTKNVEKPYVPEQRTTARNRRHR